VTAQVLPGLRLRNVTARNACSMRNHHELLQSRFVWSVTFSDLLYRYRQFLIAIVGAGVVLATALALSGLAAGFSAEINWTIGGIGAERWVLNDNSHGLISNGSLLPQSAATAISQSPGVTGAAGLAVLPQQVARINGRAKTVLVFGVEPGNIGSPAVTSGRALSGPGQVVTDVRTGAAVGSQITVGSMSFRVVGQVVNRTMLAGSPIVFMPLHDAQVLDLGGRPLITAVVTRGIPSRVPAGLAVLTSSEIEHDNLAPLDGAISSINNTKIIMWVVAAIIVAALLYVSALQRVRDFAVLKALGSSSLLLFESLALQAVVVTLLAAVLAMIVANFMGGFFAQPVVIPASAFATLPVIAIVVGLVSSLVAIRRATSADPAAAFGG
jgi:putative ABC transport system permease protein